MLNEFEQKLFQWRFYDTELGKIMSPATIKSTSSLLVAILMIISDNQKTGTQCNAFNNSNLWLLVKCKAITTSTKGNSACKAQDKVIIYVFSIRIRFTPL